MKNDSLRNDDTKLHIRVTRDHKTNSGVVLEQQLPLKVMFGVGCSGRGYNSQIYLNTTLTSNDYKSKAAFITSN